MRGFGFGSLGFSRQSSIAFGPNVPLPAVETFLFGNNISMGEFDGDKSAGQVPGSLNSQYFYAGSTYINKIIAGKQTIQRYCTLWERLQRTLGGALYEPDLTVIDADIAQLTAAGIVVVLDVHNYGGYRISGTEFKIGTATVTSAHFSDLWTRLANRYKSNPLVWFGLMNEPNDIGAVAWAGYCFAAAQAVRATGATNKILLSGTEFSSAFRWVGAGNSSAWEPYLPAIRADGNMVFEVHQYPQQYNEGNNDTVYLNNENIFVERLGVMTDWCLANGVRAYLGEFNAGSTSSALGSVPVNALANGMAHMLDNTEVWIAATPWTDGAWNTDYYYFMDRYQLRFRVMLAQVWDYNGYDYDLSDFQGYNVHFDATDASTYTQVAGSKISSWTAKGANAFTVSQSDDGERPLYNIDPLNGKPTIHFFGNASGTNCCLANASISLRNLVNTSGYGTCIILCKHVNGTVDFKGTHTSGNPRCGMEGGNRIDFPDDGGSQLNGSSRTNQWTLYIAVRGPTSAQLYYFGTLQESVTNTSGITNVTGTYTIGANDPAGSFSASVHFAHLAHFGYVFDAFDRQLVQDWVQREFGISA